MPVIPQSLHSSVTCMSWVMCDGQQGITNLNLDP